ncbi:hypothetical protein HY968_01780 [Candidatus Kaiserbacteria bacterium]|nr:hypothetical protein [Candidatus Kaiserbacteria bacterium]
MTENKTSFGEQPQWARLRKAGKRIREVSKEHIDYETGRVRVGDSPWPIHSRSIESYVQNFSGAFKEDIASQLTRIFDGIHSQGHEPLVADIAGAASADSYEVASIAMPRRKEGVELGKYQHVVAGDALNFKDQNSFTNLIRDSKARLAAAFFCPHGAMVKYFNNPVAYRKMSRMLGKIYDLLVPGGMFLIDLSYNSISDPNLDSYVQDFFSSLDATVRIGKESGHGIFKIEKTQKIANP